jgi:hypothetical protein
MPQKLKISSALRAIPAIVTTDSGIVTADSGNSPEIGHDQTKSPVTLDRNSWSRSNGMTGHDRRNTHSARSRL